MDLKLKFDLRIIQNEHFWLWSRKESPELLFERAISKKNYEPLGYRIVAIWHWGNSCETIQDSSWSSVQNERNHTYEGKEVEGYSCVSSRNWSWDRCVIMIMMSGNWRSSSLENDESKIAESVWRQRSAKVLGPGGTLMKEVTRRGSSTANVPTIPWCIFVQFKDTLVAYDSSWIDGSRRVSIQLERVCFHRCCSFQHQLYPWDRTHCWRKRRQWGKTHHLLHTSQPFWGQSRWRSIQWRSIGTKEGALPQQLETYPRWCLLDKIVRCARSKIAILTNENLTH